MKWKRKSESKVRNACGLSCPIRKHHQDLLRIVILSYEYESEVFFVFSCFTSFYVSVNDYQTYFPDTRRHCVTQQCRTENSFKYYVGMDTIGLKPESEQLYATSWLCDVPSTSFLFLLNSRLIVSQTNRKHRTRKSTTKKQGTENLSSLRKDKFLKKWILYELVVEFHMQSYRYLESLFCSWASNFFCCSTTSPWHLRQRLEASFQPASL